MKDIFNFIQLTNQDNPETIVFLVEVDDYTSNKELYNYGYYLFNYLLDKGSISSETIVLISFIKHFSKSIKNMIISKKDVDKKEINVNQIVIKYININKNLDFMDNYLIFKKAKDIYSLHHIKKDYPISNHHKYYQ